MSECCRVQVLSLEHSLVSYEHVKDPKHLLPQSDTQGSQWPLRFHRHHTAAATACHGLVRTGRRGGTPTLAIHLVMQAEATGAGRADEADEAGAVDVEGMVEGAHLPAMPQEAQMIHLNRRGISRRARLLQMSPRSSSLQHLLPLAQSRLRPLRAKRRAGQNSQERRPTIRVLANLDPHLSLRPHSLPTLYQQQRPALALADESALRLRTYPH